jgi:F-type H+-transporting ATPase subunit b
MINIDGSVWIQVVNFVFLIWALNAVMYKPIRNILTQRNEKVNGLEKGIETFGRDAQEKDEEFSAGIRTARSRGQQEKAELLQEAADDEKEIIAQIAAKAQDDLEQVRRQIAGDADAARQILQKEVDSFAAAIGHKILGRAIS